MAMVPDLLWHDNNTWHGGNLAVGRLASLQTESSGAVPNNWLIATSGDYLKA